MSVSGMKFARPYLFALTVLAAAGLVATPADAAGGRRSLGIGSCTDQTTRRGRKLCILTTPACVGLTMIGGL